MSENERKQSILHTIDQVLLVCEAESLDDLESIIMAPLEN